MLIMAFASRHLRYIIAGVVTFLVTIFLLSEPPRVTRLSRMFGSVEEQIELSESYYQNSLKERNNLIRKWGPSPSQVDSFPSNGEFYTLWDFFTPAFQCPYRMQRVGTLGDGGKWVCGMERIEKKKECVIYSAGVNGESSFEAALLERAPGCQVYGYDFSVNSMGPEIEDVPHLKNRAHFKPYALSGVDAHHESPPRYTLRTLMKQNNHTFIDILKIDIEGSEFEVLDTLIDSYPSSTSSAWFEGKDKGDRAGGGLPFGQLQLELHVFDNMPWNHFSKFLQWWEKLEIAGLRPFWTEPNLVYVNLVRGVRPDLAEYSFLNIRGSHELVSDAYM